MIETPEMAVDLVAFDSMGARSMCTYIETKDVRITIDPAVALAEKRFNLGPHAKEVERMGQLAERVKRRAMESDVIIVTHYHYDHHDPGDTVPNSPPLAENGIHRRPREKEILDIYGDNDGGPGHCLTRAATK